MVDNNVKFQLRLLNNVEARFDSGENTGTIDITKVRYPFNLKEALTVIDYFHMFV